VVPKPIRQQAGIEPGDVLTVAFRDGRIEIEHAPRQVRIEEHGGFRIAEPAGPYEPLDEATVKRTREDVRTGRKGRNTKR